VIETPDGNLSKGMRQLNGVYTQASNRRHGRIGHLFQGRYKAILVDRDAYLLELTRYVVLNPVRAGMVAHPGDWRWSSYLERMFPIWQETDMLRTHCIQAAFRLDGSFFLVATRIPLLGRTEGNWTSAAANNC